MDKKLQCLSINKNPQGNAIVQFVEKDEKGKAITIYNLQFEKSSDADKFKHLSWYHFPDPVEVE
jgi:hypothetical protein